MTTKNNPKATQAGPQADSSVTHEENAQPAAGDERSMDEDIERLGQVKQPAKADANTESGNAEKGQSDAESKEPETRPRTGDRNTGQIGDLADVLVRYLSPDSEPSPVRDYYLTLRRRGRGAPDAVSEVIEDFMEELRTAVAQQQRYNERHHRVRLGLPPAVQMNESLLPRSALVRRIFRERLLERPLPRSR